MKIEQTGHFAYTQPLHKQVQRDYCNFNVHLRPEFRNLGCVGGKITIKVVINVNDPNSSLNKKKDNAIIAYISFLRSLTL